MNWFTKISQVNSWWEEFYYHMNNSAYFILEDNGIIVDSHKTSINDGSKASFMMKAHYNNEKYTIRIILEFNKILNNLKFGPMGSGSLQGIPLPFDNLIRSQVSIIAGSSGSNYRLVLSQYVPPNNTKPAYLMEMAKNAILNDVDNLDDDDPPYEPYSPYDPDADDTGQYR